MRYHCVVELCGDIEADSVEEAKAMFAKDISIAPSDVEVVT